VAEDDQPGFWRRVKRRLGGKDSPEPKPPASKPDAHEPQASEPREQAEATPGPIPDPSVENPSEAEPKPLETTPLAPTVAEDGEPSVLSTSELKTDGIGRVYAQSLLEIALEQGQADAIAQEMQQLLPILDEGGELDRMMDNPSIGQDARKQIVQRVFEGKVSDLLYRFLQVVANKDRLASLPQIVAGYLILFAEHNGQLEVEAFVASPMDDATADHVAKTIGDHLGKQVTLRQHVDESLIGGLKIKIGDRLIDASVASQLRSMKNKMIAAGRQ
jgi:F-type H+-transporting ATPase subunit delta